MSHSYPLLRQKASSWSTHRLTEEEGGIQAFVTEQYLKNCSAGDAVTQTSVQPTRLTGGRLKEFFEDFHVQEIDRGHKSIIRVKNYSQQGH